MHIHYGVRLQQLFGRCRHSKVASNDVLIDGETLISSSSKLQYFWLFRPDKSTNKIHCFSFHLSIDLVQISATISWTEISISPQVSPLSNTIYNTEHLFSYTTNYCLPLCLWFAHASNSHLETHSEDIIWCGQRENNLLDKIQLMKVSILLGNEKDFSKIMYNTDHPCRIVRQGDLGFI